MHILAIRAHPFDDGLNAHLFGRVLAGLRRGGHAVEEFDLYAAGFDPVLCAEERRRYHDIGPNETGIEAHLAQLRRAEGLVFCYPTWNFGVPAILKGYFDRVWVPGATFSLAADTMTGTKGGLPQIERLGFVTTYGAKKTIVTKVVGDPVRKVLVRGIARLCAPKAKADWLPLYDMNNPDPGRIAAFADRVEETFARW